MKKGLKISLDPDTRKLTIEKGVLSLLFGLLCHVHPLSEVLGCRARERRGLTAVRESVALGSMRAWLDFPLSVYADGEALTHTCLLPIAALRLLAVVK